MVAWEGFRAPYLFQGKIVDFPLGQVEPCQFLEALPG